MTLVRSNNANVLAKLLQRQPKIDLETVDSSGNTPLLLAAHKGLPKCVCALLSAGANYKHISVLGESRDTSRIC